MTTCQLNACGDGHVYQGVEACDDGNGDNTDTRLNTCRSRAVEMGLPRRGEQCDDGNLENGDTRLNSCLDATCGDGFVQDGVEECDDANE